MCARRGQSSGNSPLRNCNEDIATLNYEDFDPDIEYEGGIYQY